jgi:nuclear transport factor 2 (NTF2) superfamily protein
MPTANTMLTGVLAEHVRAVNATDTDAVVATFAEDAFINDVSREIQGLNAIRAFVAKEIVGDNVTMDVTEVIDHHGDTIVRAAYDGDYDKTDLPDPLILTNYFSVRDEKIISLITIRNRPSEY